jgi:hypothetical protein
VTHQLQFLDEALNEYRAFRADKTNEAGQRIKAALERLRDDPGGTWAACSRWESLGGKVWALSVPMPDISIWLVLWGEQPGEVNEIFYIGPAPGETKREVAWSSEG